MASFIIKIRLYKYKQSTFGLNTFIIIKYMLQHTQYDMQGDSSVAVLLCLCVALFFWCLGMAVLRDCGIPWVSSLICMQANFRIRTKTRLISPKVKTECQFLRNIYCLHHIRQEEYREKYFFLISP